MLFREIRAFFEGVRAAFPRRKTNASRKSPGSDSPARIVGHSVRFLAVAVLVWAAAVVTAVGLAGRSLADGSTAPGVSDLRVLSEPSGVREEIAWDDDVVPREWTAIVLHHSATDVGSAASFDAYHRNHKGWQSLGYHFVIGNGTGTPDGKIEVGPRWRRQKVGAHANSGEFNRYGIGICLVGNFEHDRPTSAQIAATKELVATLARQFDISPKRLLGHCDIREGGTACPGKHFPLEEIRRAIGDCRLSTAD